MPTFDADIKHWPTVTAFVEHLSTIPRPSWVKGITNHNTYIPNEFQWRGMASMQSMMRTYIGNGWSAGPHLYLAAEAPNASDRGIWQMTPLTRPGVHAGACNTDWIGIENVGDFQARPPTPNQYHLMLAVNRAILQAWGLTPASVNVHKECMPGRTCPGRHLDPHKLRRDLAQPAAPKITVVKMRTRVATPVFTARNPAAPLALGNTAVLPPGETIEIGDLTDGWAWIKTGLGFAPLSCLELL